MSHDSKMYIYYYFMNMSPFNHNVGKKYIQVLGYEKMRLAIPCIEASADQKEDP
jgi:hypothetical protein